ncbi:MAG: CcmD family protein [Myxococcota bacterium]|nr:CcmD family protein [Myxococcota bacterium]
MTQAAGTNAAPQTADGRSTSFQAVQGEPEHYSGETLLVTAYALIWMILFAWIAILWRKQSALDTRLAGLEREIDKAAAPDGDKRRS